MALNVKVKKLDSNAVIPSYSHYGDGCMDLTATSVKTANRYTEYGTGLAFEIPYGYVGLMFPRSSCSKYDLVLANCVGVIDHQYRGELKARFKVVEAGASFFMEEYKVGDRVAQIMIIPRPEVNFIECQELQVSQRGDGGFGSTGN